MTKHTPHSHNRPDFQASGRLVQRAASADIGVESGASAADGNPSTDEQRGGDQISVVVIDDQELIRQSMASLLGAHPAFNVLGTLSGGADMVSFAHRHSVDVYIVDAHIPTVSGADIASRLRNIVPRQPLVMLANSGHEVNPGRLMRTGAMGFISKSGPVEELYAAVRAAYNRRRFVGVEIAQVLATSMLEEGEDSMIDKLSKRELQVLSLISQGHNIHSMSEQLKLSTKTVSTYRYRVQDKLNAANDVELTHIAMLNGLASVGDCFSKY